MRRSARTTSTISQVKFCKCLALSLHWRFLEKSVSSIRVNPVKKTMFHEQKQLVPPGTQWTRMKSVSTNFVRNECAKVELYDVKQTQNLLGVKRLPPPKSFLVRAAPPPPQQRAGRSLTSRRPDWSSRRHTHVMHAIRFGKNSRHEKRKKCHSPVREQNSTGEYLQTW